MPEERECGICGKAHDEPECGICRSCLKEFIKALSGEVFLSPKKAEAWAFLLGTIDLHHRWASEQIVSHEDQIDTLTLDFENHIHSQGKVFTPYQRRAIIPRRP